jgi:hypothetical protein
LFFKKRFASFSFGGDKAPFKEDIYKSISSVTSKAL